ncbi:HAMP domain-containing sensor histidine kinase [Psychrobacillus lasiicapitis]|uniref:Heme sensor protein HssS n=1 Tax=Psychrobacillus lasiicapitis TaxID=1636719 RepID=A0A544T6E1_9BACI|nr:HAMP domain-containing sensor histidine kinase [Psychrobacillus lasiicapitis]TQR13009.1 HAMP domain-containing histidine kinase [Psychrobacillus lasiicapitis]GGA35199.1 two-component sensor histidine kinase [Psychrobacillus lasiicapitis]
MKTLYSKFVWMTLLIMFASGTIGFMIVNTFYHQNLKEKNDEKNVEVASSIVGLIESSNLDSITPLLQTIGDAGYQIYVVNEDGLEQFYGGDFRVRELPDAIVNNVLHGEVYHGMREFPKETFITGYFSNELTNTVGVPFTYDHKKYALFQRPNIKFLFNEIHLLLGGLAGAMIIISIIAMLIVAKRMIDPLTKLTVATNKIANEDFQVPILVNQRDEIGQLADSFRNMVKQLEASDRYKKEFIARVSHDFQTPLLNIQGYATLLENGELNGNYAEIIRKEAMRLSGVMKQLLLLTSFDQANTRTKKEPYRLDEQLKQIVMKFRWLLDEKNISIQLQLKKVEVLGDKEMLEYAWENLISNAIKYNYSPGEIQIAMSETSEYVQVIIQDSGIGNKNTDYGQWTERFYREDQARSTQVEGSGLGLAIVKEVIQSHHGILAFENVEPHGTKVSIQLKKM